ncbi:hypothetical protein [Kitasatospora sp. NPDC088548]|uniref:hypothetical protein n=1 Tax=Kitasatospora sp. NPDC088548 TaxID=3364075 RepID=UPI0037FE4F5C
MATNTTSKTPTTTEPAAPAAGPPFVGPPLQHGQEAEPIRLAHHLAIDRADYLPGTDLLVSPDYARQLRTNGYVARTRR